MASAERTCRAQMSCCGCNVPRLSTYLIALHHLPVCLLTTMIDLTFLGGYTLAGIFNIATSGFAMANALRTTKCGEGCSDRVFCGDGYHRRHNKELNVNGIVNNEEYYEKNLLVTALLVLVVAVTIQLTLNTKQWYDEMKRREE